jgi:hypothetical protein
MKFIFIFALFVLFQVTKSDATDLRGQLVHNINGTYVPLGGVRVDLMVYNGKSWEMTTYAFSGKDGFYFFINCKPGITFTLRVYGNYFPSKPLVMQDLSPNNYQDVPAIDPPSLVDEKSQTKFITKDDPAPFYKNYAIRLNQVANQKQFVNIDFLIINSEHVQQIQNVDIDLGGSKTVNSPDGAFSFNISVTAFHKDARAADFVIETFSNKQP